MNTIYDTYNIGSLPILQIDNGTLLCTIINPLLYVDRALFLALMFPALTLILQQFFHLPPLDIWALLLILHCPWMFTFINFLKLHFFSFAVLPNFVPVSPKDAESLEHAFITLHIDYCNALFCWITSTLNFSLIIHSKFCCKNINPY